MKLPEMLGLKGSTYLDYLKGGSNGLDELMYQRYIQFLRKYLVKYNIYHISKLKLIRQIIISFLSPLCP